MTDPLLANEDIEHAAVNRCVMGATKNVRYQPVIGLAEIPGQHVWGPAIDLFGRDEKPYAAHWREWA